MDVTRSSLGAGVAATATLLLSLVVLDWVFAGTSPVLFATFTGLCAVGGPPYCELGSPTAALLTYVWFALLFAVAWPLLFGGFTWGLPGESGLLHGLLFGVVLWTGYAVVVVYLLGVGGSTGVDSLSVLLGTFLAYAVYGLVLGGVYDRLADHRTFLDEGLPG